MWIDGDKVYFSKSPSTWTTAISDFHSDMYQLALIFWNKGKTKTKQHLKNVQLHLL